jgi:gas vesicle protein
MKKWSTNVLVIAVIVALITGGIVGYVSCLMGKIAQGVELAQEAKQDADKIVERHGENFNAAFDTMGETSRSIDGRELGETLTKEGSDFLETVNGEELGKKANETSKKAMDALAGFAERLNKKEGE